MIHMIHITQAEHDAFKAAVAERDRLLALTAWLPIETAPRDGTTILLGRLPDPDDEGDLGESVPGYWLDEEEDGVDSMGADAGFTDVFYQSFSPSRSFGAEHRRYPGRQPTHWKPLPEPPKVAP